MSHYAKIYWQNGNPTAESLEEHTKRLVENIKVLKALYGEKIDALSEAKDFWHLLELACAYHDVGKVSTAFQNRLRRTLDEKPLQKPTKTEVPHNYLSPAFLPEDLDGEALCMLLYAIAFHHARKIEFSEEELKEVIHKDLSKERNNLKWLEEYGFNPEANLWDDYYSMLEDIYYGRKDTHRRTRLFILLKGLLHRLDHSASAGYDIRVESERVERPQEKLLAYLERKSRERGIRFEGLKSFQKRALELKDSNVMLTASTGIGKTEFALSWIDTDKAFYTLPVRVSVNAMYERLKAIFTEEKVGILHGDTYLYIEDEARENTKFEKALYRLQSARQLSMPLTVTTADQLFTATFKWNGYEKIYATLMYSKVVLDEPQSYSPETLAIIVKGLQEVARLGGRFCFMSATVHPFIRDRLKDVATLKELTTAEKHKLCLEDRPITALTDQIVATCKEGKRVLVIVNTIRRAQEVFRLLKDRVPAGLLHSGFILKDRREKEQAIQSTGSTPFVWVTTQVVEASLDIDYDVLFTEVATLDSLVQRMGRIYRAPARMLPRNSPPNIIVATDEPSDRGAIYNTDIVELTKDALIEFDGRILTEEAKQELMERVFDEEKIRHTRFYKDFDDFYKLLDLGFEAENKGEAQWLFRKMASITGIPYCVYREYEELIIGELDKLRTPRLPLRERLASLRKIMSLSVTLPHYRVKDACKLIKDIFLLNVEYDHEYGIALTPESPDEGEMI